MNKNAIHRKPFSAAGKRLILLSSSSPVTDSIQIIRSNRRTLSLQVRHDGQILVRAPRSASLREIEAFVRKNSDWLNKHLAMVEKQRADEAANPPVPLTMDEIRALADRAMRIIPDRTAHYASLIGVTYGRITILWIAEKFQSPKGNLNFNCLLMMAPPEVLDYVIVHELCHRKEMNHSPRFWSEVARVIPDYRIREKWLKTEGTKLMRRMTG